MAKKISVYIQLFFLAVFIVSTGVNVSPGVSAQVTNNGSVTKYEDTLSEPRENSVKTKGVLDRFEEKDKAIILIEEWKNEFIVPRKELPIGSDVNTWFDIKINDEGVEVISVDCLTTMQEAEKSRKLMEEIKAD